MTLFELETTIVDVALMVGLGTFMADRALRTTRSSANTHQEGTCPLVGIAKNALVSLWCWTLAKAQGRSGLRLPGVTLAGDD
jgi:hypothetical protein